MSDSNGRVVTPTRRDFFAYMGSSVALSGAAACTSGPSSSQWTSHLAETRIPYRRRPEDMLPGNPQHYATGIVVGGRAQGVIVECHEGRPVSVAGNDDHTSSFGGLGARHLAVVDDLYHPARLKTPMSAGKSTTWAAADAFLGEHFAALRVKLGEGLLVVSTELPSPTVMALKERLRAMMPKARWLAYEPVTDDNESRALRAVFGERLLPTYRFAKAKVVVSLDADFLGTEGDTIRNAKLWAYPRRLERSGKPMHRLYAIEGDLTLTGSAADNRLRLRSSEIEGFTWALAAELQSVGTVLVAEVAEIVRARGAAELKRLDPRAASFVRVLAKDLVASRRRSLLIAGRRQPPSVHVLVSVLNFALGDYGRAVQYFPDRRRGEEEPGDIEAIEEVAKLLQGSAVETLVTIGGNILYTAPVDLRLADALPQARTRICLSAFSNETNAKATWVIPRAHPLEAWGDSLSTDGTGTVQQQLIAPLYGGRSDVEMISWMLGKQDESGRSLVYNQWKLLDRKFMEAERRRVTLRRAVQPVDGKVNPEDIKQVLAAEGVPTQIEWRDFPETWQSGLYGGALTNRMFKPRAPGDGPVGAAKVLAEAPAETPPEKGTYELSIRPDFYLYDGTHSNNPWLNALPDPITGLTWGNAAQMSPKTAAKLGLADDAPARIEVNGRSVTLPTRIVPGTADGQVTLHLGYGRHFESHLPDHPSGKVGVDVGPLRSARAPFIVPNARISQGQGTTTTSAIQARRSPEPGSVSPEGGDVNPDNRVLWSMEFDTYRKTASSVRRGKDSKRSRRKIALTGEGHQWGMVVNLNSCIGCNACVMACGVENNTPPSGAEGVRNGQDRNWIRVERHHADDEDALTIGYLPVMCQHCQVAPCEQACPTQATTHSPEGLNEQSYGRCAGQQACIAACPFDVRRFNVDDANRDTPEVIKLGRNPNVTVRSKGVVEKCTLCVQRINDAKRRARVSRNEAAALRVLNDLQPACAQVCPTGAISFGSLSTSNPRVARLKRFGRSYTLPAKQAVEARVSYLAKVRNPNPKLKG